MCIVKRRQKHRQLAEQLQAEPTVTTVDTLMPNVSPSGQLETEILAQTTLYGGVPSTVLETILDTNLTVVSITRSNHPDYRQVVVR